MIRLKEIGTLIKNYQIKGEIIYMDNNTIKEEINETYKKLLIKNLSFEEWNQDQQYFGSILYLGILTIKEIYNFSCGLIYSKVNCSTKNDKDELTNKKEGIKRFTKKISDPDYIKDYIAGNTNAGDLYKKEISKKESENYFDENVNYRTK